jgi:hypothetical protein
MAEKEFETSVAFAIFILLLIFIGPKAAKVFYPSYENVFSTEAFKSLMIFMVLFVSNKNIVLSLLLTGIFVIIMNMIREKNEKSSKTQEDFVSSPGLPVSDSNTYDKKQSDFLGMPFYPLNDRNNFVEETPYYRPSLDYDNIDMNTIMTDVVQNQNQNNDLSIKTFNIKY